MSEAGDFDCQYVYDQSIYGITLADPNSDPHGRNDSNFVDDGYCCEG